MLPRSAPDVERALSRVPEGATVIAFAHNPALWPSLAPENAAAMAVWLASAESAGITGQVFAVGGGKAQMLEGWRPATEVAATDVWSLDSLTAARDRLTGGRDTGVPPFMPPLEG